MVNPEANLKIAICSGNPAARREHSQVDENTEDQLDRDSPM
jgi:triosephosphate isomerase